MIQLTNVKKIYPNNVVALKNIDLRIEQGEFVYVVGPSGSGKSTLMKLLYRQEKATHGTVQVDRFFLDQMKDRQVPKLRRHLGVIFQDFKLLPRLTVYENVAYALEVTGASKRRIKERVLTVLDQVGLKHKIHQYPDELSGGEQQRVAIARAIANEPAIIIADEPTGNLDPQIAQEILHLLEEINQQGTTVIMGTHNDVLVNEYRHRVISLEDGFLVRDEYKGVYES
ncbi:cell division ATP-binding protein FtsE [Dolosicoccus paucivorans]|uniref:Cell division ATP-binding protein FtsE n=1 Tax=Dolosicoccus paucivorans TaxID=84521 RepID=A0A2N6SLZ5_9LACT|nr:cell division ATP-binding protein FtsE [Dolosicoccus paucivorans]PMB83869.1 cell division ATP-binding protein FtsE [Dolosicoccus paucivorans]PMC58076.1 cell division ATP-binding protein FtsE [Dolosicoccus paucivorans]